MNHFSPFHVVEEEGLGPVGIVEMPEGNGPANVEAEGVKPEFGCLRTGGVGLVAVRVEGIVAYELPGTGMERVGSRFENQGHGSARRQAVLRAVV